MSTRLSLHPCGPTRPLWLTRLFFFLYRNLSRPLLRSAHLWPLFTLCRWPYLQPHRESEPSDWNSLNFLLSGVRTFLHLDLISLPFCLLQEKRCLSSRRRAISPSVPCLFSLSTFPGTLLIFFLPCLGSFSLSTGSYPWDSNTLQSLPF